MTVKPGMTVGYLVNEMEKSGVLGAGKLAKAVDIMLEMFLDPDYTVYLAIAGPMVLGGLKKIISHLVKDEYVNALVMSGANIVHDIVDSLGYKNIQGSFSASDEKLRDNNLGRVGDIYIDQSGFEALERWIYDLLNNLPKFKKQNLSIYHLLHEIGKRIDDKNSILKQASIHNIPIFSPGILDSMLGFHLWTYSQLKTLKLDPLLDFNGLSDIVFQSKKSGVIILGGSIPKHHVLGANILRDGVDSAIQVTLDRPEGGSLSGAPLEESISWKKIKSGNRLASIIGDATIIFPIMVAATLEKLNDKQRK
ncbi:deoxyhypusine synthase family protein [Candidatus Bathyarchaeota archaeon]|nr:deoxyhypusine synthase family protein [Candidatus Bathyarchaeota archaeon]